MKNSNNKKLILIIATLSSFLTPFVGSSINVALPSIGKEFGIDAILLSWTVTSYVLAAAVFLIPFGRLADIHGRKRIFTFGVIVHIIAAVLLSISNSALMLILLRVLQGMGSAMIFGTGVSIITSVFPRGERGKALGINSTAVYLGSSLGPFFGGFLTQYLGWRSIFISIVLLGSSILYVVFSKLKGEWAGAKGEKFDFIGSTVYGSTLIFIMLGLSFIPKFNGILLILIGIVFAFMFIKWQTKTNHPLIDINLFRKNKVFAYSNLAALINYSATYAIGFLLSLYLQYIKGFSPQNTGLVLVSQPIMQAVFSPFAGKLSDKIEPRIIASSGMALITLGLFFFVFINENTPLEFIIGNLMLFGFGFALFSSPNVNAVMSSVRKKFYGVSSATLSTMRLVGQMLSMGIVTMVFATYIGRIQITAEYYPLFMKSLKVIFLIFAVFCFVGIFASFSRGKMNRGKK